MRRATNPDRRLRYDDEGAVQRLLFLLHGMGRHEPGWAEAATAALVTSPATYGYSWFATHGPLDAHVAIEPIEYDGVFARYLKEWGTSTEALRARGGEFGVDLSRILGWLEDADEVERNFFWTHVVDVVLYRFFSIVTAEVRLRVRAALVEKLVAAKASGGLSHTSVLGHSLGTAVAHDVLALLGSQPIPTKQGPNRAWMAENHTFANVFMCSNVSRVLETQPKVYESVLHPSTGGPGRSYVDAYYTFRHRFDPFPVVRPFAPVGWGANYPTVGVLTKVPDFNVHALERYLADPRVHIPILRGVIGRWAVTPAEETAAKAAYDATAEPPCAGEVVRFKAASEKIIALARTGADPVALVVAGVQFLARAQEARDACGK